MTEFEKARLLLEWPISGYKIAKETGVSQSQISRIRAGLQTLDGAKYSTIRVLANYYDELKAGD